MFGNEEKILKKHGFINNEVDMLKKDCLLQGKLPGKCHT